MQNEQAERDRQSERRNNKKQPRTPAANALNIHRDKHIYIKIYYIYLLYIFMHNLNDN